MNAPKPEGIRYLGEIVMRDAYFWIYVDREGVMRFFDLSEHQGEMIRRDA